MGSAQLGRHHVDAALAAAARDDVCPEERAAMLVDIATTLHRQALSAQTLNWSAELYRQALALYPSTRLRERATAQARAVAAQLMAGDVDAEALFGMRDSLLNARDTLEAAHDRLEAAQCDMTLGLIAQQLAANGRVPPREAVAAYQRALRVLNKSTHPCEFAVIQSNLATNYLQGGQTVSPLHEALAIQALESALSALDRQRHPHEYGMVQNNLGNALQSVNTAHPLQNLQRALSAYDEALSVRTRAAMPEAYASTLSNKAACLCRMPDDPAGADGQPNPRAQARLLYAEAAEVFAEYGDVDRHRMIMNLLVELDRAA